MRCDFLKKKEKMDDYEYELLLNETIRDTNSNQEKMILESSSVRRSP